MPRPPFHLDSPGSGEPIARRSTRSDDADIAALHAEIERLLLITEGLWRIVKEKLQCDENELIKQITVIDLEDGKLDARKPAAPPQPCPKCGRVLAKHRPRCLFCGEPIAADPFAR
jgi:ribosomal protein S27AE